MKNFLGSMSFLVVSAIFLTGTALLVTLNMMGTAVANKVTLDFDNVKQGALGEYNSKEARELYNPNAEPTDKEQHTLPRIARIL